MLPVEVFVVFGKRPCHHFNNIAYTLFDKIAWPDHFGEARCYYFWKIQSQINYVLFPHIKYLFLLKCCFLINMIQYSEAEFVGQKRTSRAVIVLTRKGLSWYV